jgi:O-antigen/teichoic acid export membrane protein
MVGTYSYVLVNILNGLVLIPLFLRYFGVDLYGAWLATSGMISMFALLEGGINQVITQRLAKSYARKNPVSFRLVFSSGLIINTMVVLCMIVLGCIFAKTFQYFIHTSELNYRVLRNSIILATLGVALTLYQNTLFSPYYAWQRVFIAGIINSGTSIMGIVVNLVLLFNGFGIISISISLFLNGLIGFLLAIFFVTGEMRRRHGAGWFILKFRHTKFILKKSAPLYLNTVINTVSGNIEPVIIGGCINSAAVVMYNVTYKLISMAGLPINAIAGGIMGSASHLFGQNDRDKQKSVVRTVISIHTIISVVVIAVLVIVNKDFVRLWVGEKLYGGDLLTILFGCQVLLSTRFNIYNSFIQATGNFKTTSLTGIIVAVSKLALLTVLILTFRDIHILPLAAILTLVAFTFYYYPNKVAKIVNDDSLLWRGTLEILIGVCLVAVLLYTPYYAINWFQLVVKSIAGLLISFIVLFLLSGAFRANLKYLKNSFIGSKV